MGDCILLRKGKGTQKKSVGDIAIFPKIHTFAVTIASANKIIKEEYMKAEIHPANYRPVVFKDMSNDDTFITRSTINAKETIDVDGVTYPLIKIEISNTSHPFYTGKQKLVDTAGRVDKFMSRYGNRNKK
jgi:large subunit ribosomal protein L31